MDWRNLKESLLKSSYEVYLRAINIFNCGFCTELVFLEKVDNSIDDKNATAYKAEQSLVRSRGHFVDLGIKKIR